MRKCVVKVGNVYRLIDETSKRCKTKENLKRICVGETIYNFVKRGSTTFYINPRKSTNILENEKLYPSIIVCSKKQSIYAILKMKKIINKKLSLNGKWELIPQIRVQVVEILR